MNHTYARRQGYLAGGSDGSRTLTLTGAASEDVAEGSGSGPSTIPDGVLRLRGAGGTTSRRVVWTDDTVDNEGMGKKSSKICCIYHKPRAFDESSSSSSGSDSDSGTDSDSSNASSSPPSDADGDGRQRSSSDGPSLSQRMKEKSAAKARAKKGKERKSHAADHQHEEGCEHYHSSEKASSKKERSTRKVKKQHRSGRTVVLTETMKDGEARDLADDGAGNDHNDSDSGIERIARNAYERVPS